MQKFILENLDCNSCAKKLEKALHALPSVKHATINFNTNTLYLQASDISEVKAQIAKIEPNVTMLSMSEKIHNNLSYRKELIILCLLLASFLIIMLCLHYTAIESSDLIQKLNTLLDKFSFLSLEKNLSGNDIFGYLATITPFNLILHILLILLYIIAGMPIFQAVYRNVCNKIFFDENTLMFVATIAAFCIGEMSESVAVMLFFRIGEFLESIALKKSKKSLHDLLEVIPEIAHVQKQDVSRNKDVDNIAWEDTHAELLKVNDIILIKVGEKIPVDGVILHGASTLDMRALNGESKPTSVKEGDEVLAGAINMQCVLTARVSKPFCDSQISKIKEMVEQSSNTKAKSEKVITSFAQVYTPIMFFIALAIACIPPLFDGEWHEWIYRGLVVLMVSCPCALVLSVPLGYFGALGIASKKGILIKGGIHFTNLSKLQNIVFDKTGTLTQGIFQIQSVMPLVANENVESLLEIARRAQRFSNHPIAHAIMKDAKYTHSCPTPTFKEIAGKGVYVECCDERILVGNLALMQDYNINTELFDKKSQKCGSIAHVAKNGIYIGYITLGDKLKEDSKKCIEDLYKLNILPIAILSGDNKQSVEGVAKELNIQNYYAELLPTQKAEKLQMLMQGGLDSTTNQAKKHAITAFMGDGINDCVVLKIADIGISIGAKDSHNDISKESADIVLTNPSPLGIVHAVKIARKIQKITWQNIAFALGTKLMLVLLGIAGIANMWLAVFGDVGVALLALLNALRVVRV